MTNKGFIVKKIMFIVVLSGLAVAAQAQHTRFGVKAGGMLTTADRKGTGSSYFENKIAPGLYAGGLAEYSFKHKSDKFKLQLEADYSYMTVNHRLSTINGSQVTRAHMLSVPVLAKYFLTPCFSLYLGPTANFSLSSNTRTDFDTFNSYDAYIFHLGGMVGANYYIYKGLFLEARYHALVSDYFNLILAESNYGTIHNFQLGVGYKF